MLLKTMYVKRIAADLGIHRIRTRGKTVVMETNMELEAFDMLASAVSSDTLRASLSYERGRIEVCSLTLAQAFCVSFYCTPIVQCMSSFSHMKSILQKQKISYTLNRVKWIEKLCNNVTATISKRKDVCWGAGGETKQMKGLIGLPVDRQMERIFVCLAEMRNGLPSFVKYIWPTYTESCSRFADPQIGV